MNRKLKENKQKIIFFGSYLSYMFVSMCSIFVFLLSRSIYIYLSYLFFVWSWLPHRLGLVYYLIYLSFYLSIHLSIYLFLVLSLPAETRSHQLLYASFYFWSTIYLYLSTFLYICLFNFLFIYQSINL